MVCGSAHILHFSNQNKAHKRVHTCIRRVRLVSHRQFRPPKWSMGVFSLASLIAKFAHHNGPWEFSHSIRRVRLCRRQFRLPNWTIGVFSLHLPSPRSPTKMVHGSFLTASLIASFAYQNGPREFSHCIRRVRLVSHRQVRLPQ